MGLVFCSRILLFLEIVNNPMRFGYACRLDLGLDFLTFCLICFCHERFSRKRSYIGIGLACLGLWNWILGSSTIVNIYSMLKMGYIHVSVNISHFSWVTQCKIVIPSPSWTVLYISNIGVSAYFTSLNFLINTPLLWVIIVSNPYVSSLQHSLLISLVPSLAMSLFA